MTETMSTGLNEVLGITRSLLRLSPEQLQNLAVLCLDLPGVTLVTADRLQRALCVSTSDAVAITRAIHNTRAVSTRDIAIAAAVCAQCELVQGTDKVEVVCTAPTQFAAPVRATFATMMEMVTEARSEIAIVGYVFTAGASEFITQVSRARERGVSVIIIGNRLGPAVPTLKKFWEPARPPTIYSWDSNGLDELASLHAKLLICDRSSALVTSANFSLHGLHENLEIGLKVRSPSVERLSEFVRQLIDSKGVAPVPWG